MANYDSIDLDFTWDGDFVRDDNGDLKDTSYDLIQSLRNEIHDVCRSEFGDWEAHPQHGAGLSDFLGEANSRETGQAMTTRLRTKLVGSTIVQPEDINVQVIPVARHQVLLNVIINATATPGNNLDPNQPLVITLIYDSLEDSVFFMDESIQARQFIGS